MLTRDEGVVDEMASERLGRSAYLVRGAALWAPWLLILLYWIHLWNRLRLDWSAAAEYAFGWTVPFLAVGLLYMRWESRPAPRPIHGVVGQAVKVALLFALLLHIPLSVLEEANTGWRALLWFREIWLLGLSFGAVALAGGWPWARHFAFPLCFTAIAVPWPSAFESALTQTLMQVSAAIAVEALNIAGIAAIRHGNLIEVATGVVGVEEACSGMRGLQTGLMISLVLGELGRLSFVRRFVFVLVGVAAALLLNLLRAIALSCLAAKQGLGAVDQWHDAAGIAEFAGILAAMLVIFWVLRPRVAHSAPRRAHERKGFRKIPDSLSVAAAVILVSGAAATAAWYRFHESRNLLPTQRWTIQRPSGASELFRNLVKHPIPKVTQELLRAPQGWSYSWSETQELKFQVFFFRWPRSGDSYVYASLAGHRPEICMPAAGFVLDRAVGTIATTAHGVPLSFEQYRFLSPDGPLYVFYCFWEYGRPPGQSAGSFQDHFQAAWKGQRLQERQLLEIFLTGARDDAQAVSALQAALAKLIVP
jgi:exosortase